MNHRNELGGDGTTCDLIQPAAGSPAEDGAGALAESLQIKATYSGAGGERRMEIGTVDVGSGKTVALEPEIIESLETAFAGLLDRLVASGAGTLILNLGTGLLEHRPAEGVAELYDLESSDPPEALRAADAERLDAAASPRVGPSLRQSRATQDAAWSNLQGRTH